MRTWAARWVTRLERWNACLQRLHEGRINADPLVQRVQRLSCEAIVGLMRAYALKRRWDQHWFDLQESALVLSKSRPSERPCG